MEVMGVLMFVLAFFWLGRGSQSQKDVAMSLLGDALWSATLLALVDRLLPFALEVVRLSV